MLSQVGSPIQLAPLFIQVYALTGSPAPAAAVSQVMWNGAAVVGPALGGIIVNRIGLSWAYGIDVASYVVALTFALMLRPQRPVRDPDASSEGGLTAVLSGLRYLKHKP